MRLAKGTRSAEQRHTLRHSSESRNDGKGTQEQLMADTLFAKIIRREIPADIVYEDDDILAFRDVNPQAPVHVLFIPKTSVATLDDLTDADALAVGKLVLAASRYAKAEGFAANGYRCVINCNRDGGQTVFHLHLHLLAGRQMHWPPG
jgi:histidine triad (HIT) family protein